MVKWYVDGWDYFWVSYLFFLCCYFSLFLIQKQVVLVVFEKVKEIIYIVDWWLFFEFFLCWFFYFNKEWCLD